MKRHLPGHLSGIVWTAIRHMITEPAPETTVTNIEGIRAIAHLMSEAERVHTAEDIRRQLQLPAKAPNAPAWYRLASWLESGAAHTRRQGLPRRTIPPTWFALIQSSLAYICHRHTYATVYACDIARLIPLMTPMQMQKLASWCAANVLPGDDRYIGTLAAALDPCNRHTVTSSATARQVKEWARRTPGIILGEPQGFHESTTVCFRYNGRYHPLDRYLDNPAVESTIIPEFITSVNNTPAL